MTCVCFRHIFVM